MTEETNILYYFQTLRKSALKNLEIRFTTRPGKLPKATSLSRLVAQADPEI